MARVLIVDDDPDILRMAEKLLSHQGHLAFTAPDAWKATEILNQFNFDLLISDAKMPHVSGFDLIQTLRKDSKFKNLSIAMLTGLRDKKDIQRAIEAGVDDYIVKPIDPLIFLEKINSLFAKRPPQNHPQANFDQRPELKACQITLKTELLAVSEMGVVISTTAPFETGQILELDAPFFNGLGMPAPPLKVLTCEKADHNYNVQLVFLGASESLLQRIRSWIFSHGSQFSLKKDQKAG